MLCMFSFNGIVLRILKLVIRFIKQNNYIFFRECLLYMNVFCYQMSSSHTTQLIAFHDKFYSYYVLRLNKITYLSKHTTD